MCMCLLVHKYEIDVRDNNIVGFQNVFFLGGGAITKRANFFCTSKLPLDRNTKARNRFISRKHKLCLPALWLDPQRNMHLLNLVHVHMFCLSVCVFTAPPALFDWREWWTEQPGAPPPLLVGTLQGQKANQRWSDFTARWVVTHFCSLYYLSQRILSQRVGSEKKNIVAKAMASSSLCVPKKNKQRRKWSKSGRTEPGGSN